MKVTEEKNEDSCYSSLKYAAWGTFESVHCNVNFLQTSHEKQVENMNGCADPRAHFLMKKFTDLNEYGLRQFFCNVLLVVLQDSWCLRYQIIYNINAVKAG